VKEEFEHFYILRSVMIDPKPSVASAKKLAKDVEAPPFETPQQDTVDQLSVVVAPKVGMKRREMEDDDIQEESSEATKDDQEDEEYDYDTLKLLSQQISRQMQMIVYYTIAGNRKTEVEERKIAEEEQRFARETKKHQQKMDALRMDLLKAENENLESEKNLCTMLRQVEEEKKAMTKTMKKRKTAMIERPSTEKENQIIATLSQKYKTCNMRNFRHLLEMLPSDHPKRLEFSEKFIQDYLAD
jgi:hypothetical protein